MKFFGPTFEVGNGKPTRSRIEDGRNPNSAVRRFAVPRASSRIPNLRRFFRVRRGQVSGHSFRCRPKGEPFWGGNLPFVHGTFLFCFALRKPFALFCRAKKGEKTLEAPQAAPLRLELPVVRHWRLPLMSGIALFQVLCRFPYLSGTTALRLAYRLP